MRILYVLLAFFISVSSAMASQVSLTTNIVRILNYEGHSGTLLTAEGTTATNGFCPRNDYYILPLTHQYYSQNYSLLLGAKLAGKKVTLILSSGNCVENMPKIMHIHLDE